MWAQLKSLFYPSPARILPTPCAVHPRSAARNLLAEEEHCIEEAFMGMVLGIHSPSAAPLNDFEQRALKAFDELITSDLADNRLVPRLPAVLPKLMNYFRDPSTTGKELAELIARDMVSVSEVIRLANSPFYRRASEVRSIEQAVVVLGQRGLRQMVANLLVRPIFSVRQGHFSALAGPLLWAESEKTALVSAALAKPAGADEFSAYLAGISSNLGLLAGCRVLDSLFKGEQVPSSREFRIRWQHVARRLTARIARAWEFPEPACDALAGLTDTAIALPGTALLRDAERSTRFYSLQSNGRLPTAAMLSLQGSLAERDSHGIAMDVLGRLEGNGRAR